jgi:hypothetical protein
MSGETLKFLVLRIKRYQIHEVGGGGVLTSLYCLLSMSVRAFVLWNPFGVSGSTQPAIVVPRQDRRIRQIVETDTSETMHILDGHPIGTCFLVFLFENIL